MTAAVLEIIDRSGCDARRHGDDLAYHTYGCRCADAREEWRVRSYARRHGLYESRLRKPKPTVNRLRILCGVGYGWRCLADEMSCGPRVIRELAFGERTNVYRGTVDKVRALYIDLIARPAPSGQAAARAINTAMRQGWGVVDLEVVHRALSGQVVVLTPLEKLAVIYTGEARGVGRTALSEITHCSGTTISVALAA